MTFRSSWTSPEYCLSGLPDWSVWMDSNHRPRAYQARALATWATDRFFLRLFSSIHCAECSLVFPSPSSFKDHVDGIRTFNSTSSSRSVSLDHHIQQFSLCGVSRWSKIGGDDGIRTHDPLLAGQVLSQLSYTPILLGVSQTSLIEAWQLNNKSYPYNTNTHSVWFFVLIWLRVLNLSL